MRHLAVAILALAGACSRPAPRKPTPVVQAPRPPPPPVDPFAPWPMAMNAMVWTPDGAARIGELPSLPIEARPLIPWYAEATAALDKAAFDRVVAAMRSEHVPGLSLRGQAVAPWLGQLRDLPQVTALLLDDTAVDAAALAQIDLPLERIYLARTRVDDAAIVALAARAPHLQVIDLEDTIVGDAAVRALAALPELRAVNLAGTRITDAGGAALRSLARLEIVDLGRTSVAGKTVAALRDLPVRELFLDRTRVGKELATLAGFAPGLRRFDITALARYRPTDADLGWLAKAPELIEVGLSGSRVTDKLVLEIVKLPKLERVRLAATPITIASIRAIAARIELREVDLASTPVDDAAGAALIASPLMFILRLDETPITDAALRASPGLGLGALYLARTAVTDAGLVLLDQLPHMHTLSLGETAIGDATIARIARLPDLTTLVLSKVNASRESLAALGALRALQNLYLDRTHAGDATLAALAPLRGLRILHVASSEVSDAGVAALRAFPLLEELTAGDTRVRAAIAELDAWPRLRILSLTNLPLDDTAVRSIAKRGSLEQLDLSATDVTDPAPLAALPYLRVLGLSNTTLSVDGQASAAKLKARGIEVVR